MKFLKILGLTALVWLTGCASTGGIGPMQNESSPEGQDRDTYSLSGTTDPSATYPAGKLRPITSKLAVSKGVAQLSPPADIWERVRRGYGMAHLESELVADREQWYVARPDYILRMTERSRKYLFYIVEELERRNMPTELALLPFIESAFNPQAVSSANAAGMWQFMPATGKHFELKQNAFRDDRRDVLASTRAALDYLQKLYRMFGDWELALAAYNWGEGSVGKAIAKNKRAGLGLSYSDLNMPTETRFYVPQLLALKNIVSNPQAFNASLPRIGNHPYFQTVDIHRDIDVALAAKLAEVSLDDFKALNPSASRTVIFAAGTPQILLPWDNAVVFQTNLDAYGTGRLASWTVWQAPSTMNAADAARQVGMSEDLLRSINKIPPRMKIKAGSSLLVTRSDQRGTEVTEHLADNGQLSLAPEVVLKRLIVKARKKDSVASLAQRYRVSSASVAEWNKVAVTAAFKTGKKIVLYLPSQPNNTVRSKRVSRKVTVRANDKRKPRVKQAGKSSKSARVAKR
jgi:membrane-bound lytic murein transglycosylase D